MGAPPGFQDNDAFHGGIDNIEETVSWYSNIARIVNADQCHNLLSGNEYCHKSRFSIVSNVIIVAKKVSR